MHDSLRQFYTTIKSDPAGRILQTSQALMLRAFRTSKFTTREDNNHPWSESSIDARIARYRTAEVVLTVTASDGKPLGDHEVTVRQVRHKFLFGCNGFLISPREETAYNRLFEQIFNYTTLPFYWGLYEGFQGSTDAERIHAVAEWCRQRGITVKGHPLVWQFLYPSWIELFAPDKIKQFQMLRISREIKAFAGLINIWDVVNEAVLAPSKTLYPNNPICNLYNHSGRLPLVKECFATARATNEQATLILNDTIVDERYELFIATCLAGGVPLDAIGLQSHMHTGVWSTEKMWDICERFAKNGKPLHFTELTVLSGKLMTANEADHWSIRSDWPSTPEGEHQQAAMAKDYYRLLFSHPAVEAITWWDFSDAFTYMGAPAGLLRKDMSPKPAYDVLKKLIREIWWTGPFTIKTNAQGQIVFRGFLGEYILESAKGRTRFTLDTAEKINATVVVE